MEITFSKAERKLLFMKMLNKIISMAVAIGIATTCCTVNSFASEMSSAELIRRQVINEYHDDIMFQQMSILDPEAANEYISNEVTKRMQLEPYSSSGAIAYCTVPLIRQAKTNYCGYAAELMALYGFGEGSSISGSNNNEKQTTLAKMQDSSGTEDAVVWMIARDLNKYVPDTKTYSYTKGTSLSQTSFTSRVYSSLYYNRPAILHAMTGSLSYYQGVNLRHYLVVDQIDQQLKTVQIADSHWNTNAAYYGKHTETIENAYNTINITDRYLISV